MGITGDRSRSGLVLTGCVCSVLAVVAGSTVYAQDEKPADTPIDAWAQIVPREAPQTEDDPAVTATVEPSAAQSEPDWSELGRLPDAPSKTLRAAGPRTQPAEGSAWSRND